MFDAKTLKKERQAELKAELKMIEDKGAIYEALTPLLTSNVSWQSLGREAYINEHAKYSADYEPRFEAETLNDAMRLMEQFSPLTIYSVKDSCLSFLPEGKQTGDKHKNADKIPVGLYLYTIDGLRQHEESKEFSFFVTLGGFLLKIAVEIKNDPDTRRSYRVKEIPGGYAVEDVQIINKSGYFGHSVRFWSSHDQPNRFVLTQE